MNDLSEKYRRVVGRLGGRLDRRWRLAELREQGKRPEQGPEQGLLLNPTLLFADPILQTTIHLQPLSVPGVDFVGPPGYPRMACDETPFSRHRVLARRIFP